MGNYAVLKPCMVGNLHYAQVPTGPIIVDDTVAQPLVESGDLTPVTAAADDAQSDVKVETPHRRRVKED